jgi:putative transcriptional regulator
MARVTSESFAERLLRSAEQAVAIKRGEATASRISRQKVTVREVVVEEAPRYKAARIVELRNGLGVSQTVFAAMIGVRPVTIKAWEQGQKEPSGAARRLLQVLEVKPAAVVAAVRMKKSVVVTTTRAGSTGEKSAIKRVAAKPAA